MKVPNKKAIIISIISILLVTIGIRIHAYYSKLTMPNFELQIRNNNSIDKSSVSDLKTNFIFIKHFNALTKSVVSEILSKKNNLEKIIIVNDDIENDKDIYTIQDNVYVAKANSWHHLMKKFKLPKTNENRILIYNPRGILEFNFPIKGKNKWKILSKYEDSNQSVIRGNVEEICITIKKALVSFENGIYYFTQQLNSSCSCFKLFQKLENIGLEEANKIKLILIGEWRQIDTNNLLIERNSRVIIKKASEEINQVVDKWKRQTNRNDFNLIGIKIEERVEIFPLLDLRDYYAWNDFEKKMLDEMILKI